MSEPTDRDRMLTEMASNPLGFMLMRLDMSEVQWVDVMVRYHADYGRVIFVTNQRGRQVEWRPVYETPQGQVEAYRSVLLPPRPMLCEYSVEFLPKDLVDQALIDINWHRLVGAAKDFLGTSWSLVRVLSNEHAWERIKWIWGENVERNPWI